MKLRELFNVMDDDLLISLYLYKRAGEEGNYEATEIKSTRLSGIPCLLIADYLDLNVAYTEAWGEQNGDVNMSIFLGYLEK